MCTELRNDNRLLATKLGAEQSQMKEFAMDKRHEIEGL
jgi:hypothetical protein